MGRFGLPPSIVNTRQTASGSARGGDWIDRPNRVHAHEEAWRPPAFAPPGGQAAGTVAALRRFLDLQGGSIWHDLQRILPHLGGTIVDVGCGAQPYRTLLPTGADYIGLDTLEAKSRFGYEMPGTRYIDGDIWPLENDSADVVLCTETLEHVPDVALFLGEAARCLAPGGTLVLTVPFAARWHFVPHDYWRFTPSGLDRVLREAGFLNTRVYARGNALTVACYKSMALILHLAMPQARAVLVRLTLQGLSLPLLPVLLLLAILANLSLRGGGGEDCLGYTALAEKRSR